MLIPARLLRTWNSSLTKEQISGTIDEKMLNCLIIAIKVIIPNKLKIIFQKNSNLVKMRDNAGFNALGYMLP